MNTFQLNFVACIETVFCHSPVWLDFPNKCKGNHGHNNVTV